MKIAVLGTGSVGSALGRRWAQAGHAVYFGAREPASDEARQVIAGLDPLGRLGTCTEAIAQSDAVLLAIPWDQVRTVLESAGSLEGKILIDCVNPLTADLRGLELGFTTSAAEQIAQWFPAARVIKAFNTLSAATMLDPSYGDLRANMFYCGDDSQGKAVVERLSEELGFDAVDCGPLVIARQLEPLAMLYVHLAIFEGWGGDCAFRMLKR